MELKKHPAAVSSRPPRPFVRRVRGTVRVLLQLGLIAGGIVAIGFATLIALTALNLPDFNTLKTQQRGQMIVVKAMDGSTAATIGPAYGEWLAIEELPDTIKTAMVAVEDRRFYTHWGVDPIGLARAMVTNFKAGHMVQGGSTITQQAIKNVFLTSERSYNRKIRELIMALALETQFSKDQILELYLNRVYFGGGAYGVDAASRRFFGHSARTLSLPQAAVVAGLVKAPTRYAPTSDPHKARERAKIVLTTMVETGRLSAQEAGEVNFAALSFAPPPREATLRYFIDWALADLEKYTDETQQPLEVETTLDPALQLEAERSIRAQTPKGAQGALVAMANDGAVRAIVGGRDYVTSSYNRATVAERQPGSAFKLFVYLAALEIGVEPTDFVVDEPLDIDGYSPRNNGGTYAGEISVEQAFAKSVNTVAVKLAEEVGYGAVAGMARRFGISTPIQRNPAMALGVSEVTLMDMTSAYAAVARGGMAVRPYAITRITTPDGDVLYQRQATAPRVLINNRVAANAMRLLKAAVEEGTARRAKLDRDTGGKTGTTQSNRDGWFLGFTADMTTGVWMGRDDNKRVPGLAGGRAPTLAWAQFMKRAIRNTPATDFVTSVADEGVVEPDQDAYGIVLQETLTEMAPAWGDEPGAVSAPPAAPEAPKGEGLPATPPAVPVTPPAL